jgi:hypothetical protein
MLAHIASESAKLARAQFLTLMGIPRLLSVSPGRGGPHALRSRAAYHGALLR